MGNHTQDEVREVLGMKPGACLSCGEVHSGGCGGQSPYPVTNFPSVTMTDSMNEAMGHVQKVTGQPFGRVRGKVVCVQWDDASGPAVFDGLVNDTNGTCSAVVRGMGDPIAILIHWSQISGEW